jgi:hypothetical protein
MAALKNTNVSVTEEIPETDETERDEPETAVPSSFEIPKNIIIPIAIVGCAAIVIILAAALNKKRRKIK